MVDSRTLTAAVGLLAGVLLSIFIYRESEASASGLDPEGEADT